MHSVEPLSLSIGIVDNIVLISKVSSFQGCIVLYVSTLSGRNPRQCPDSRGVLISWVRVLVEGFHCTIASITMLCLAIQRV